MLPSVPVVIRALQLWFNTSNTGYLFCNKRFKVFIEVKMSEDQTYYACNKKPTLVMLRPVIILHLVFLYCRVFIL